MMTSIFVHISLFGEQVYQNLKKINYIRNGDAQSFSRNTCLCGKFIQQRWLDTRSYYDIQDILIIYSVNCDFKHIMHEGC